MAKINHLAWEITLLLGYLTLYPHTTTHLGFSFTHTHCKKQSSHKEELVGNSQEMSKLEGIRGGAGVPVSGLGAGATGATGAG